jgi:hypothetical protein
MIALVFAGFHGIYTAVKNNGYSISYNMRFKEEKNGFMKTLIMGYLGHQKWSRIIQKTFEK